MAEVAKVLGQGLPAAATLTDLYTVPVGKQAVISTISMCNTSAVATSVRVSVAIAAAGDTLAQYLYRDLDVPGNLTFQTTAGFTMGAGDVLRVYNLLSTVAFNVSGVEITP